MSSFKIKTLRVSLSMGEGLFDNGSNTITIEGLPAMVDISKPGGEDKNKTNIVINGLSLPIMDRLTTLAFRPLQSFLNVITVEAGDRGEKLSTVFSGEITTAFADFNNAPSVSFKIEAMTGAYAAQIASPPISIKGTSAIADLMQKFASEAGYNFKNEGVTGSVQNTILNGSPIEKAQKLKTQTGIEMLIDDRTIIILPNNQSREGNAVFLSDKTGMLGYPTFTNDGISIKAIFNPMFQLGGLIQISSVVPKSSGTWQINKLTHKLEAYQPNSGVWESKLDAVWVQE